MCKLLKLLITAAFCATLALPASAGWNLRQDQDGGTYWRNSGMGGAVTGYHILRTYLSLDMTDMQNSATAIIISPVAGFIEKIYTVLGQAVATSTATWQFWISDSLTSFRALTASQEITNGTTRHTTGVVAVAGGTSAFVPRANGNAWAGSLNESGTWVNENYVKEGGVILVQSNGFSGNLNTDGSVINARVLIVINPKGR